LLAQYTLWIPAYFTQPYQLYPRWPEWHPEWAFALFSSTALVLFLPKLLATIWIWTRAAGAFGRGKRAAMSVVIETIFSALFAPIRMLFHTQFVVTGIAGITVRWKSPPRADSETSWSQAFARHGFHTAIGVAWTAFVWYLNPHVLPWVLPVAGALVLSIPLSVYSSRVGLGRRARWLGLFLTPEEIEPPAEVQRTMDLARIERERPGLEQAIVDPAVNALACASGTPRFHEPSSMRDERNRLVQRVVEKGVESLDRKEAGRLLNDPVALSLLHLEAWIPSGK
jgi:membrane glycosyltransferase